MMARQVYLCLNSFTADDSKQIDVTVPMPTICPRVGCGEPFPKNPSKNLQRMVGHYHKLLKEAKGDETAARVYSQSIFICIECTGELRRERYLDMKEKMWPTVNFERVTDRVLLMESEIIDIVKNEATRAQSIVYQMLLKVVGGTAADLRKIASTIIPPGAIMTNSRPG